MTVVNSKDSASVERDEWVDVTELDTVNRFEKPRRSRLQLCAGEHCALSLGCSVHRG